MSRNWILLTGLFLLGSVGTSHAHPLDSPDIVYVDEQPCNRACQAYLSWSRRKASFAVRHSAPLESAVAESPPLKIVPGTSARRPARDTVRRANLQHGARPAARRVARQAAPAAARIAVPKPASEATVIPEPALAMVAPSSAPEVAALAAEPAATAAQVAAVTPPAGQVTPANAPAPQQEATAAESSANAGASDTVDTTSSRAAMPDSGENRVAVVMTRAEIESLSDLAGQDVAIEEGQAASSTSIKAAIASAGAAEVRLAEGAGPAVDRLISGEVPAAVLAVASPDAAEQVREMPGYRIFRIPLSPG